MSVELHPDIEALDKSSLCYSIYSQLYHNFFNSQQKKDDEHPYGIVEGDDTSIRLKNTAYGFASAIAGAVAGEGASGGGGLMLEYLKKTGGDMTGLLRAQYGFEAGVRNTRILETYVQEQSDEEGVVTAVEYGVRLTGALRVGGDSLYLGGRQVLRYDADEGVATLDAPTVDLRSAEIYSSGRLLFGDEESGIVISPTHLLVGGMQVYHQGNANLGHINWEMQDATVRRDLAVSGNSALKGGLEALQGVSLGDDGKSLLTFSGEDVALSGFLSFLDGYGIRIGGTPVLVRADRDKIQLGSLGGDLLLGTEQTPKIRLFSGLFDLDGEYLMLSPYGKACFPGSLTVRHNYGAELLSSYRVDASDEGIVIHKNLRLGSSGGFLIRGENGGLALSSSVAYDEAQSQVLIPRRTFLGHRSSTSLYAPQNRRSESFFITTDGDFITADTPLEARGHIGIDGSYTQLTDGILYLTEALRLQAVTEGIKHYGNSFFKGALSSEFFSSGFAGSGWAIQTNLTTGSVTATFDEIVARKKFRAYEFEVMKINATNGSLWVSDSCSGDQVEKIA